MILWITFAILSAMVVVVLLWPVMRGTASPPPRASFDLNVYRDQLAELQRDEEAGMIVGAEAEAARAEIARRILAVKDGDREVGLEAAAGVRWPAMTGAAFVLVVAVVGYLTVGSPGYRDVPRAERISEATKNNDLPALVVQVEQHLAQNPKDGQGWLVLAPAYRRLGRFTEAADAFARAIELTEPSAELFTALGETLVLAENGLVTDRAQDAFQAALKVDAGFAKARFYDALAYAQDGKTDQARAKFEALLKDAPADAAWRTAVERQIAALASTPKGPALDDDQVKAADEMSSSDRQAMIRSMVDRLDSRLREDGDDIDGWLRLINARMVLGDKAAAQDALTTARRQFDANQTALTRLTELADQLGLEP